MHAKLLIIAAALASLASAQNSTSQSAPPPESSPAPLTATSPSSSSPASAQPSTAPTLVGGYAPQKSPVFPPLGTPTGATGPPTPGATVPTGPLVMTRTLVGYPPMWTIPPVDSAEVVAAIAAIDWTYVPNSSIKKADANGNIVQTGYSTADPDCWWSYSNCVTPKVNYIPPDVYYCPRPGDWGLTYDDGPFNLGNSAVDDLAAEPNLYNFLAAHNQTATLFYIGGNVWGYPQAAQRALADGHVICGHTWSHHASTTLTNAQIVAEFYWTAKVIKESTGITPKCWRPPYGDVDDRIRAIAWQMGMTTMIWDEDTNDWNMPGTGGGNLSPATVDGYFQGWISKAGNDSTGHIVLEHELNNATVAMAEKWLPQLQQVFKVVTVQQCMNISQPYWEPNWVYPTEANPIVSIVSSVSSSAPASASASAQPASAAGGSDSASIPSASTTPKTSAATHVVGLSVAVMLLPVLIIMMQL